MGKYFYGGRFYSDEEMNGVIQFIKSGRVATERRSAKTLRFAEGPKVLDVGCAMGAFDYALGKQHPSWQLLGVDVLKESIRIANENLKLPNVRFEVRDVLEKKFKPNSFDCVLFLETIEHVDNPGVFLKEFHRILKPRGCLVVSTPNALSFLNIARHFGQNITNRLHAVKREPRNMGAHLDHVASYDVFTLIRLLDRNGFTYETHDYAQFSVPLSRDKYINLGFAEKIFKPFCDDLIIKARKKPRKEP